MTARRLLPVIAILAVTATNAFAGGGRIIIRNDDKPDVGFNDPTPAAPVGNNHGTTLGEQRLNVFLAAAERWQNLLDIKVDVIVAASFAPILDSSHQPCDATGGILGHATPRDWVYNFPDAPKSEVWYPVALANQIAGKDLVPSRYDIFTEFNSDLDKPTCLGDVKWYYGMDRNHGSDVDLYVVVLHEFAHGLGFATRRHGGQFVDSRPSVFDTHALDLNLNMTWGQMNEAQRKVSLTNNGKLVWAGDQVRGAATRFLTTPTVFTITSPAPLARNYEIGTASFGPPTDRAAMGGRVVQGLDASNADGPATTDGCSAFTNASAIAGNVAMVDRGTCFFATKARNAQAAGAIGVIVVDNKESCTPPAMGGDGTGVMIPAVSLTTRDGDAIKEQLAQNVTVTGMLRVDPSERAGASREGYVRLYAPCTHEPGSSTVHWDSAASPNLLMEPNISSDLLHGVDLTLYMLMDIGWAQPARTGRRTLRR